MAPRRAAAVSAASSISNTAAGPSKTQPETPSRGNTSQEIAKGGRKSQNGQQTAVPSAGSSQVIIPSEPLSPIISRLRKMWKFAAICQFLFTFDEAFGMSGFETEALERDLDGTEKKVIPDLMRRLLYTLTLNRNIDEYNWEDHLREQYLARHPDQTMLGTLEVPFPWAGLPLRQKIETLHQACEWQLWDAERFRKLVKNEEDSHIWRIDPVGWDSKNNTYWLFDDNRLWVQHPSPEPVKAKAPPKKNSKKAKMEAAAVKRAAAAQKRKREEAKPKTTPTRASTRNRTNSGATETPALKRGRVSRRSTGRDGWEEIPPGLLYNGEGAESGIQGEDGESELSDPPPAEDDEDTSMIDSIKADEGAVQTAETSAMDAEDSKPSLEVNGVTEENENTSRAEEAGMVAADEELEEKSAIDEGKEEESEWIEFETVAVTKREWEAISLQFAKSKHPDEKLLHQFLNAEVLPKVMADIAEVERQKAHEAAMANRKRSSRIALKESEREEKERDRVARLKMEEKMAAIRAEEAQKEAKEREEMDQAKIREERLREREERMAAREREAIERAEREIFERENRERMREMRKLKREQVLANGGTLEEGEGMQHQKEQDDDSWELNCEVCGKAGINLDDTEEIVCCENCLVWQHTDCWNGFDRQLGRPRRDWENVDFYCTKCRPPAANEPWPPAVAKKRQQEEVARGAREQQQQQQMSGLANASPAQISPLQQQLHYQQRPQQYYPQSAAQQQYYQQQAPPQHTYSHHVSQQQNPQAISQQQYGQPSYSQQQHYPPQYQRQYQAVPQQTYHAPQHPMPIHMSAAPVYAPMYHGQQQHQPSVQNSPPHVSQYPQQWQQPPQQQMQRQMHVSSPSYNSSNGIASEYHQRPTTTTQHNQITPQHMQRPMPQTYAAQYQQNSAHRSVSRHMSPQNGFQQHQQSPSLNLPSPLPLPGAQQSPQRVSSQVNVASPAFNGTRMDMPAPQAPIAPSPAVSAPKTLTSSGGPEPSETVRAAMTKSNDVVAPQRKEDVASQPMKMTGAERAPSPQVTPSTSTQSPGQVKPLPASPKVSPGLQRNASSQPSGSFPLRHATARSPLSRPDDYDSPSAPTLSLGPSQHRANSPSPNSKLHQRSTSNLGKQDPLFHRQSVTPNQASSLSSGPGPSSGSLARLPQVSKSPTQPSTIAASTTDGSPAVKMVVQSLPPAEQPASSAPQSQSQIGESGKDFSSSSSTTAPQGRSNGISTLTAPTTPRAPESEPVAVAENVSAASILPSLPSEASAP